MGQIKFVGNLLMIGLFTLLIVNYAINFASDNNASVDLANNTNIANANTLLKSDLSNVQVQANASDSAFREASIKSGDETTEGGGMFKTLTASYGAVQNILKLGQQTLGGDDEGISPVGLSVTVLGAFLSIVSFLYVWKTWAGKNPD